jgi:hypothetical protein
VRFVGREGGAEEEEGRGGAAILNEMPDIAVGRETRDEVRKRERERGEGARVT